MGEKKVTFMVLKVDLQCEKCYKKVKKVLCKFPQIRDQEYDEKKNLVLIKVVCCSPEKIRDKLCCKGGGAIKSIEIRVPETTKPDQNGKPATGKPETGKPETGKPETRKPETGKPETGKPETGKPETGKPGTGPVLPYPRTCCTECYGGHPGGPCQTGYGYGGPRRPVHFHPLPLIITYPCTCSTECYGGHPGGPCQTGYGYGGAARYDGYCGRPVCDGYSGGRTNYCVTRSDCFSEENPQACAIM